MTAVIPDRQITEYLSEQKKQKQQRSSQEIKKNPMKKVCKNRKNCGKIEITQEDENIWEEENESQ